MSRLVDLCRQCIVFDELAGLAACLRAIRADPDVAVVRVKNRLDPAYDARRSAGYRSVALNLRVVGPLTEGLGVDLHVCEVQLLHRPFAELKVGVGTGPPGRDAAAAPAPNDGWAGQKLVSPGFVPARSIPAHTPGFVQALSLALSRPVLFFQPCLSRCRGRAGSSVTVAGSRSDHGVGVGKEPLRSWFCTISYH